MAVYVPAIVPVHIPCAFPPEPKRSDVHSVPIDRGAKGSYRRAIYFINPWGSGTYIEATFAVTTATESSSIATRVSWHSVTAAAKPSSVASRVIRDAVSKA